MNSTENSIFVDNGGSSSIKFALFTVNPSLRLKIKGEIERIGTSNAVFSTQDGEHEAPAAQPVVAADYASAVKLLIDWINEKDMDGALLAVGHRIVHGGPNFYEAQRQTAALMAQLRQLMPLDRQHMPGEISLARALQKRFPNVPQVVCFDTAFHHELPRVAQMLPIPRRYEAQGVRRYGFHGLSYEFLMSELNHIDGVAAARGRIILAHLGNGASLAAVSGGKPVDTSMGFTPTAGVPMGTRSGDLDPGLVAYFARTEKMDAKAFDEMVNFKSGLLGMSETSADMRDLLKVEADDARAADAIAQFCYQIKKTIGAYAAAMGGLDRLVFSGGIGEKAPVVRARICDGLGFLGIELDAARNEKDADLISTEGGRVKVHVIRTNEELVIARSVCNVLGINDAPPKQQSA
ncbi:MAG: acetate/propionate family kinase [Aeromicrobium sp.]|nr:acetate/propionate family kinase [Burkholderiales bacterium]